VGTATRYDAPVKAVDSSPEDASGIVTRLAGEGRRWREQLLSGLLRAIGAGEGLMAIASLQSGSAFHWSFAPWAALLLWLSWSRRGPFALRVLLLVGSLIANGGVLLVHDGLAPMTYVAFATAVVLATVLLDRRWGFATLAVTVLLLGAAAWLHGRGLLPRYADWAARIDIATPAVGVRIVLLFAALGVALVLAPALVLERSTRLAVETTRAQVALAAAEAERARMEAELARREAALVRAQEAELLGRVALISAHDLGNALSVMHAGVALLDDDDVSDDQREVIADLRNATAQADAAVQQLRMFGPSRPRPFVDVALAPMLRRATQTLYRVLPTSIAIRTEIEGEPLVRADEGQLLRVVRNLALNARDAMRKGGTLTFRLHIDRGKRPEAVLEITDTGQGMAPEVLARIFEPFFTTKGERGTGLGVASAREIVEGSGGRIEVRSTVGSGTTFTVRWPLATPAAPA
jgi:signal transduction histidine kinase